MGADLFCGDPRRFEDLEELLFGALENVGGTQVDLGDDAEQGNAQRQHHVQVLASHFGHLSPTQRWSETGEHEGSERSSKSPVAESG